MGSILAGIGKIRGGDIGKEIALAIVTAVTVYYVTKKLKKWDERRP